MFRRSTRVAHPRWFTFRSICTRARKPALLACAAAAPLALGAAANASKRASPAPVLRASGQTLRWTRAGTHNRYKLLIRAGRVRRVITVSGRSFTPTPVAGTRVLYRVQAAFHESGWSNAATITYRARRPRHEPPRQAPQPQKPVADQGAVKYRLDAASYFGAFGNVGYASWIKERISMIKGYPPASDAYVPLFGLPVIGYHDAAFEKLAPLTEATIQAYVNKVRRDASVGYSGTFLDDVNWSPGYRDGSQSRSSEPEQSELASLIEATRRAIPDGLIEINSQYNDIWPLIKAHDPYVERALADVNLICKEFGVGPTAGISSGDDYAEFFQFVEYLHARGIHITMTGDRLYNDVATMEYNLATYFLINDGGDYVTGTKLTPLHWWAGFDVNLGSAVGPRERSPTGVWKRRFSGGVVYTVEPHAPTQTIGLATTMSSAEWGSVSSITLSAGQGAVLVG